MLKIRFSRCHRHSSPEQIRMKDLEKLDKSHRSFRMMANLPNRLPNKLSVELQDKTDQVHHRNEHPIRFFSFLPIAICLLAVSVQNANPAQNHEAMTESKIWEGKLADGARLTLGKLDEMLATHRDWLKTADEKLKSEAAKARANGEDEKIWIRNLLASEWEVAQGRLVMKGADLQKASLKQAELAYANLQGSNLKGADLAGADLREVSMESFVEGESLITTNLQEATLGRANLQGANLYGANLDKAYLREANLRGAQLSYADLDGANLMHANLEDVSMGFASLEGANLKKANLQRIGLWATNLQGAYLGEANLQGAKLMYTDLAGVVYEPELGALPDIIAMRSASHLEDMRFMGTPHALEDLKHAFKNAGMRQQEREITHALKRAEQEHAWRSGDYFESLFNILFFNWPVGYGLYPGRALQILCALIPMFGLFYGYAIWRSSWNHGIYRIWPKERIEITENGPRMADGSKVDWLNPKGWRIILHALYFSLVSAFHFGWRDLNVGNWISRLQLCPYSLQATGWVRTVSGFQSLISVYLLAMWVLTYFGRPFE